MRFDELVLRDVLRDNSMPAPALSVSHRSVRGWCCCRLRLPLKGL
jgi:hypothetical protein